MKKLFFLCILTGFILFPGHAQVPGSFKYQAILRDASGNPLISRSVKLRISIISETETGTIVYMETHAVTTSPLGLADLEIGRGVRSTSYGTFGSIKWQTGKYFLKTELDPNGGTSYTLSGTTQLLSVPYALYAANGDAKSRFEVYGDPALPSDTALFEVKDKTGFTVFAVYEDGAILNVTNTGKGGKGGFAVGSRTAGKAGKVEEIMWLSPDTARFSINDAVRFDMGIPTGKGGKGGFAVGGRSTGKGPNDDYFNISPNTAVDVITTQPRILWYPRKEAFLAGRVLVEHPDSVGTNSTALGFESKAVGNWSQAFGFKSMAHRDYATAIGKNAVAAGMNSFAFGDGARALQDDAYAFGAFTISQGRGSFALGYVGRDSVGPTGKPTLASGDASFAFGLGTTATNVGSMGMGAEVESRGVFSFATGFRSIAYDWCSTALGDSTIALRGASTSMGFKTKALEWASTAMGHETEASGPISVAMGIWTKATGGTSLAMGHKTVSEGNNTIAGGSQSRAKGVNSIAFGDSSITIAPNSMAFGWRTRAGGNESFAFGSSTVAVGNQSVAFGISSIASGTASFAAGNSSRATDSYTASFGTKTQATATSAVAFGDSSIASGYVSTAFGFHTQAIGWTSTTFGQETKASSGQAFAAGYQTHASGGASAAFGGGTLASGMNAFAAGASTVASGSISFAIGNNTRAIGNQSFAGGVEAGAYGNESAAFGFKSRAYGGQSFALGNEVSAKGNHSAAFGLGTISKTYTCFTIGAFNDTSGATVDWFNRYDPVDPLFVVGNGESNSIRSNAFTVLKNGNVGIGYAVPGVKLDIKGGDARLESGKNWLTNSDARYKKNISTLSNSLEKILRIRGVRYDLAEDNIQADVDGKYIGFIAQELEGEFPEFVVTDENGYKAVAYDKMTAVLVEAVKEQEQEITQLRKENTEMKSQLERIKLLEKELLQIKEKLNP
ncbi:MAG: tail fiber domain-containing protein [Bacteroidales bacterium]